MHSPFEHGFDTGSHAYFGMCRREIQGGGSLTMAKSRPPVLGLKGAEIERDRSGPVHPNDQ
jgi:hypothetical protein